MLKIYGMRFNILEIIFSILLLIIGLMWLIGKPIDIEAILDPEHTTKKDEPEKYNVKVNIMEERTRSIFERIFGLPFKTIRPDWLKNPKTGKNLELDGFNPTIQTKIGKGLAFEYDGSQHSEYNPHFHKHKNAFADQVKRDFYKEKVCKSKGIALIRIPHFITVEKLEPYIRQSLAKYL